MKKLSGYNSILILFISAVVTLLLGSCTPQETRRHLQAEGHLQVLFLGDDQGHQPSVRLRDVARSMLDRGIELHYTSDLADITLDNLRKYDALLLYANYHAPHYPKTDPTVIDALINYVEEGGGFVPIHAASANFSDSERYINLVGGAFKSHGTGVFTTRIAKPEHSVMEGFEGFESWDETYVHQKHNEENSTILSYRKDEPWTWVRTQGEGRVFYTAWGHDERTWQDEGFHELLERGIRWAAGQDVQAKLANRTIDNPFEYTVLDVPFPPPHKERLRYEKEVGPMDRKSNNPRYYHMQKPLGPEEALDRMIVRSGYRVELFASEPDIVNPIYMDWDERGRLWVIESVEYPYPRSFWPDGGGKDRIVILEDTNGDYRADKFTEFADNLNILTSLEFVNGGVVVHQAPQTLFLKDTDGDDRADVRKVLFEGWGKWDTHAGPNNLHYGLDNWLWGVVGYAGMDSIIGGERHKFRMGLYRFRKDGSKLELLQRTNNNTYGLGFNERGDAFISTANGNPSTWYSIPRHLYTDLNSLNDPVTERLLNTTRVITMTNLFRQVDFVGGFTSAAGHGFYTARQWPEEYWNRRAFVTEPTVQLVADMKLTKTGSGYKADYSRNLVVSDDEWFSPIMAEVGPDGNVWIADWYNYILQHNAESDRQKPTPGNAYANPLRDRKHGRIYRIVYEGTKSNEKMSLAGADPQKLVQTLKHDNMLWRLHAQRLLVERGQDDVVPVLIEFVTNQETDEIGLNTGAIHALWTLHGLGQINKKNEKALAAVKSALKHPSAGVRANTVQVLPPVSSSVRSVLDAGLLQDEDLGVRLKTLIALSEMPPSVEAGKEIYEMFTREENMEDRWIREAGAIAGEIHEKGFLQSAGNSGLLEKARDSEINKEDPTSTLKSLVALVSADNISADEMNSNISSVDNLSVKIDAELELGVTPNVLEFDKKELRVVAGQQIRLIFTNSDNMEHNLLFIRPGSVENIGHLADQLITSPDGRKRQFVPDSPDVIGNTPILDPGESFELIFTVPDKSGKYMFVCTIPGHWRSMQGVLVVEPNP